MLPAELIVEKGGGGRAKSYDCEKAWSSINHSIFSGKMALVMQPASYPGTGEREAILPRVCIRVQRIDFFFENEEHKLFDLCKIEI
jgi:hypothetical protein